jgi:hypothetical protein
MKKRPEPEIDYAVLLDEVRQVRMLDEPPPPDNVRSLDDYRKAAER